MRAAKFILIFFLCLTSTYVSASELDEATKDAQKLSETADSLKSSIFDAVISMIPLTQVLPSIAELCGIDVKTAKGQLGKQYESNQKLVQELDPQEQEAYAKALAEFKEKLVVEWNAKTEESRNAECEMVKGKSVDPN